MNSVIYRATIKKNSKGGMSDKKQITGEKMKYQSTRFILNERHK